ncbi:oxidoreductase, NAD-binding domain protein [SAR86 cluster bacterium SAR86E]|uniref:Oxidoreductase, NAD-binding domain protein n=1 Tax=SAR86 cluster bacterium SAR86E TaxID=1208365 RepID=K6H0T8_9GAMM|nr:oxidoreductase, NAD-binding domain protein [SAR86 cluster bacterium SAR86E]
MKVGIAGYGVVGKTRYTSIIKNTTFKVTAISEKNLEAQKVIPSGIAIFDSYQDLISKTELDIIFISLPNKFAAEAVALSLEKGLHVFCEKPPARTLKELQIVQKIHKKFPNLKLMYGFNHRFHLSVEEAKRIIQNNTLGKIINMKGVYGKSQIISFNQTDWRTKREESGGGILLDQGIHMLDLMKYLSGKNFSKIFSFIDNAFWNFDVEDNAYVLMKSEDGVVAQLHSSATQWRHIFNLEITLQKGSLVLGGLLTGSKSYGDETLKTITSNPEKDKGMPMESTIKYNEDVSWDNEIQYFYDCLTNNSEIKRGSIEDAIETMKLVEAIYKADPEWKKKYYN